MKITQLIEDHSLPLHGTDASDISSVISDVTPLVERDFPLHSPQRIFWDQQVSKFPKLEELLAIACT